MKKIFFVPFLIFTFYASAQNVGIGISNPTYPLTVAANSSKGIIQQDGTLEVGFFTSSNSSAYLQTFTNHPLHFTTNNGPARLTIATNGSVGVGTTAPATTFHVSGSSSLMGFTGVGTTSPATTFHVVGNSSLIGLTGISTISPTAGLDINSSLRFRSTNPVIGAELTSADANGNAVWARPYAFKARGCFDGTPFTINETIWTKVFFNQTLPYNVGLSFQVNNSQMVAPVRGVYHFDAQVSWNNDYFDAGIRLMLNRNGNISVIAENYVPIAILSSDQTEVILKRDPSNVSSEILLETGDIVYVEAYINLPGSSGTSSINPTNSLTYFNGHLAVRN